MAENDLTSALEALEEIRSALASLNATPNVAPGQAAPPTPTVTQGITDQAGQSVASRFLTGEDRIKMRSILRERSTSELHLMFAEQARQKDAGIPFDVWASAGGYGLQAALERSDSPALVKALDSAGASALIRQDLEPVLYELYVRQFPAWERFSKEPANGLVHAYNQQTSFGDAQFMPELGTVTDDKSTYTRQTTNVAVIATRRGVSLKSQFATIQGGAGFNPEQLELTGGLRAIAHKMQKTIFSGNASDSGGTAANELGEYDANAFDGLRKILNQARAVNVDPTSGTPESITEALSDAVTANMNEGGTPSAIYARAQEHNTWNKQQLEIVRMLPQNQVAYAPGVVTSGVHTPVGTLPIIPVRGDSIGTYTASATLRADMYLTDESTIGMPYLGTDGPTVLDIPVGISGQLTHLFIIFGMWGLAVKAVPFSNKVRVKVTA